MKYTFIGGAGEVGASCLLIQVADCNILIDCGVRVNRTRRESVPNFQRLKALAPELHLIFVSHAHADHVGALPLLHKMYPETYILTTKTTAELSRVMLNSTVHLNLAEALSAKDDVWFFSAEDVKDALSQIRIAEPTPPPFDKWMPLWNDEWGFKFIPSGHILGAVSIVLRTPEGIFVYTGDVSAFHQRTVDGIGDKLAGIHPDFMWCEATYGESDHPARTTEEQNFAKSVEAMIKAGSSVLIPSFALGRAQEVILILLSSMFSRTIQPFAVVTDGLVNKICRVYERNLHFASNRLQSWARHKKAVFPRRYMTQVTREHRAAMMRVKGPKCIIASSGMLTGGASVDYARVMAPNPKDAIFLSGYQDAESPGGQLQVIEPGNRLFFLDGTSVELNCQVKRFHLSAHSGQGQLIKMIKQANPKAIALVHGSERGRKALSEKLVKDYPVTLPKNGVRYDTKETGSSQNVSENIIA